MERYEVMGDFVILFPLDEIKRVHYYEELNVLGDIIKIALEKDHLEVKKIKVRIIQKA